MMMPHELHVYSFFDLWHPEIAAAVLILQAAYLLLIFGPWRQRLPGSGFVPTWRIVLMLLSLDVVYLAEGTPLHVMSEVYLFSAHMVQHVLLTMVFPPLFLLGLPEWTVRPLLRYAAVEKPLKLLTNPIIALFAFNLIYSIYHMPLLYQSALHHHWLHVLEHALLVPSALLMWWPICGPVPLGTLSEVGKMPYIFCISLAQIITFVLITFADSVLYPFYAMAPRIWGIGVIADQQWAGIVMKLGGLIVFTTAILTVFSKWVQHADREATTIDMPDGAAHDQF